jgi:MFS family permease
VLAPFFAALFFPPGNDTAALLSAFATYAAGFLVRPFGALLFGRIGDLVGRKYTFLVTILVMGASTFAVGLLPTFANIGWAAPIMLVSLRLLQGLALGGEYGGAAPAALLVKAQLLLTAHWGRSTWAGRADILKTVDWLLRVGIGRPANLAGSARRS